MAIGIKPLPTEREERLEEIWAHLCFGVVAGKLNHDEAVEWFEKVKRNR